MSDFVLDSNVLSEEEQLTSPYDPLRRHTALTTCDFDPDHPHFDAHKHHKCLEVEAASGVNLLVTVFAAFTAGAVKPERLNIKLALPLCGSWPIGQALVDCDLSSVKRLKFNVKRPESPLSTQTGDRPGPTPRGELSQGAALSTSTLCLLSNGGKQGNLATSLQELELHSANRERCNPDGIHGQLTTPTWETIQQSSHSLGCNRSDSRRFWTLSALPSH